jgi:hypothetical protein
MRYSPGNTAGVDSDSILVVLPDYRKPVFLKDSGGIVPRWAPSGSSLRELPEGVFD